MRERTIRRFRNRAIIVHWLHTASFITLLITGTFLFFHLTNYSGGSGIKVVHRIAALVFVLIPTVYAVIDPKNAVNFLKESFEWRKSDVAWVRSAVAYYFGGKEKLPPQDRINGGQKLWQVLVILTGTLLTLTGAALWVFQYRISIVFYSWISLLHAAAFLLVAFWFLWHLYLATLHPRFDESFFSMINGKVSAHYAQEHYGKWYDRLMGRNDAKS